MTPYTTKSGVKIGIRYKAPPPKMYQDEERLQAALLGIKKPRVPNLIWVSVAILAGYIVVGLISKAI